jgi:glycosyltransferase involved in cell wall biosynthesis
VSAEHGTVSIVITCYNQASFLADAIRSAIDQNVVSAPIEIVVVDDGSTDDTKHVAAAFAVRYIHQPNRGLAAARNTGLAASTGHVVCFLDADDTLLPQAIALGLQAFHDHPHCAFVYGDFCDVDTHGAALSAPRGPRVATEHYRALLQGNLIGMHATVLYRRAVLQSAGGFDARLKRCEDYELYLRLARLFPVHEHRGLVAHYRQHESNMSRDRGAMLKAVLGVLNMQQRHVQGNPELRRAVRNGVAIWRTYYGELLFDDLRRQWKTSGPTRETGRLLLELLLRSPRALTSRLRWLAKGRLQRTRQFQT